MTPDELVRLNEIIPEVSIPAWVGRVASNFGTPGHGTPKADEFRNAALVHLPIALINMLAADQSKSADLDWFLDLVTAVNLATRRSGSASRTLEYMTYMRRYQLGLVRRGFSAQPNHHAALHLGDFLPLFGPVRTWWAFATERQIGLIQKIRTNNRFGKAVSNSHTTSDRQHQERWRRPLQRAIIELLGCVTS